MINKLLFESIARNAESQKVFDFSQSPLQNNFLNRQIGDDLPVEPIKKTWETIEYSDRTAIERPYEFSDHDHLMYFIIETLNLANKVDHHPIIKINHLSIEISLCTLDIGDVTQLDLDMSKKIDEIYEDIDFIDAT